jgi:hypothetical protein
MHFYIETQVLSGRLCVPMAVERYARDSNNLELLVAQVMEMAQRLT